jgi:hypothetical protein
MRTVKYNLRNLLLLAFCGLSFITAKGQVSKSKKKPASVAPVVIRIPKTGIRPYNEVIGKGFISYGGLFTVHKKKDTTYFEIPDTIMHRDIMVIIHFKSGSRGVAGYPGMDLDNTVIQFELGPDSTLSVKRQLVVSEADTASNIYKAVRYSETNPVINSFPIVAFNKVSRGYVVDVSALFKANKTFVTGDIKTAGKFDGFHTDYIHAYPANMEFGITENYTSYGQLALSTFPATRSINTSFIILPKIPMMRRYFDERVGFFSDAVNIYKDDQQKVAFQKEFILRWRLEPRDQDIEKWKRGELVEPKKPIVIYIDPAAPKQWHPYLIQGINDWQKAFEQAGFKNAIIGKEWPENDTTMHMDDARYSFLNYYPSETQNAFGPNVHDPRSGEIIQTHIGWYSNVSALLYDWYLVQAGAVDDQARKPVFDTELMGQLIRFVSSHEVGHTLGLLHNFGSSSKTPVDSLRNKHYLDIHGHTASIMDYARFNYVAQPEDSIPQYDLWPRIGEYDKWAIEWGYKRSGADNADTDKQIVSKWIDVRTAENARLWYGDGQMNELYSFDPRSQTEDLGDNAAKAGAYGIKNLQRILPNLSAWTYQPGTVNKNLVAAYNEVRNQWSRYLNHAFTYVGGYYRNNISGDQTQPVYSAEPVATQREILSFFNDQLFKTPDWLLNKALMERISGDLVTPDILFASVVKPFSFISNTQNGLLKKLLSLKTLNRVMANRDRFPESSLSLDDYITTLHGYIFTEFEQKGTLKMDTYRRNLQRAYLVFMRAALAAAGSAQTPNPEDVENDIFPTIVADLKTLRGQLAQARKRSLDTLIINQVKYLQATVDGILNTAKM